MSYHRLQTLTDLARYGYWVKLTCACGHEARRDPMELVQRLSRSGASVRLDSLHRRLRCQKCGGRSFVAEHCHAPEAWSR
jgi:DNA-directed RNA polymerase subunit RPC12/RpoP